MSETLKRRASDYNDQREIDKLIADETDPKLRLQLVIMNRIAGSINSMESILVNAVEDHAKLKIDYDDHKKSQEAMENRGKGIAWLMNISKGIVATILITATTLLWNDYQGEKQINKAYHQQEDKRLSDLETSYINLWTSIKSNTNK